MNYCLLKDGFVVGTVATTDPKYQPPEGFTLGPEGGQDHWFWDGERYVPPSAKREHHCVLPSVFTAEECDAIIALCAGQPRALKAGASPEVDALFARIWALVSEQNTALFQLPIARLVQMQVTRHSPVDAGRLAWQTDRLVEADGFERKLSIVLLLTEPENFAGGDFELQGIGRIDLHRGCVVIFHSPLLYRVTPVTVGMRHSLVTWAQGAIGAS